MVGLLRDLFSNHVTFNPLSPKSVQRQISPFNINIRVVMRITDMITQDEYA